MSVQTAGHIILHDVNAGLHQNAIFSCQPPNPGAMNWQVPLLEWVRLQRLPLSIQRLRLAGVGFKAHCQQPQKFLISAGSRSGRLPC